VKNLHFSTVKHCHVKLYPIASGYSGWIMSIYWEFEEIGIRI